MGINILTYNQKTVTPKDDALLQQFALGQDGFFYGGVVTYTGGNTLHFTSGEGVICGREFVLEDTDISAALPASGTLLGQVYIHIDLSNADTPIELICETAAELTELTKDENMNVNNGEYDLQLCTFTATTSAITDLSSKVTYIKKGGAGSNDNLATVEEGDTASQAYVPGQHLVYDDVYCEVIDDIAEDDALVVYPEAGANIKPAKVGAEIYAINQNLTKINTTTKTLWGYINGVWTDLHIRAFYDSIPIYADGAFGVAVDNGVYRCGQNYTTYSPVAFTNAGSVLKTPSDMYPSGKQTTLVCTDLINLSAYTKVKLVTNQGTFELDVTSVTQSAYIAVAVRNSGGGRYLTVSASSAKQDFMENTFAVDNFTLTATDTSTTFSISEIVVE